MPQPKKGPSLGSSPSHQRQMLANLARSLFEHEKIRTTEAKAKLLRPYAERLITKGKKGGIHDRRQVLSVIEDRAVVHKLFADIGPRFASRNGGYTRILKLGQRSGDGAPMALIELVDSAVVSGDGADAGGERGRRRLRRPGRKRQSELPEDKPVRSQAAEAAAIGDEQPAPEEESSLEPAAEDAAAPVEDAGASSDISPDAEDGEAEPGKS